MIDEMDSSRIQRFLRNQPLSANHATMVMRTSRTVTNGQVPRNSLQFVRRDADLSQVPIDVPTGFATTFLKTYKPWLEQRAETFEQMFRELDLMDRSEYLIVETGCVRGMSDWGAGQSTIMFDDFVNVCGGHLISIDLSAANCAHARGRCSTKSQIVNSDSVQFLGHFARRNPFSIDALYLDSVDVDWRNPHHAAMHHLNELCAAMPALRDGSLVVVDDHMNEEGNPGKSLYVTDFMASIGATKLFEQYQIGWKLESQPPDGVSVLLNR